MSQFDENNILNPIDVFVPLHANPNREIDMFGNLIRVKTQSGSFYCFDGVSPFPLFYNHSRIYNITSDSSGNTISVNYYGNNNINIYRVDLQGRIYYRNEEYIHSDSSGNNIIATEGTTATEGIVTNINNINMFSGMMIRKKIIEDNICPIRFEPIEEYDIYMNCTCCKKNFFEEEIRQWLLPKSLQNRTCPNCRAQWSNNNMYINRT
jgi:hypothetical protein